MKDLEMTWSHIVSRKLARRRDEIGMTTTEIANKMGVTTAFVSAILSRTKKASEEHFMKIGMFLGIPENQLKELLHTSLIEAIEEEYGINMAFALKTHFKLSDKGVRDAMKFLNDLAQKENNL